MTTPSSTSWWRVVPYGRMTGPVLWVRMEDGGLRKKNGCEGRAEESSLMWSLGEEFVSRCRSNL
jgi:hypothetical protein